MSVAVMARVWEDPPVGGSQLLVLLALADNANTENHYAWPSVDEVARKTKMSRRSVQRALREMVEAGLLRIVRQGGRQDGKNFTTVYEVLPAGGAKLTPRDTGGQSGVSRVSPQPSGEPSGGESLSVGGVVEVQDEQTERKNGAAASRAHTREAVQELFEHWTAVMGKNAGTILTPERQKKTEARLQRFSLEQLKTVLDHASKDPFYMGDNDRGKPFNDLVTLFRDDTIVARILEDGPPQPRLSAYDKAQAELREIYEGKVEP